MSLAKLFRRKSLDQLVGETTVPQHQLKRVLGPVQLTALGVGAAVGAGIFSSIGSAVAGGPDHVGAGPAIIVSFVLVAVACALAGFCYAEFASMVPAAGSAYTYAYATLGELVAWIIGWDLILEYAVGNVAVAISWSGYFQELLRGLHLDWPAWLGVDYRSALQAAHKVAAMQAAHADLSALGPDLRLAAAAWATAPQVAGLHLVFNLPAFLIVMLLTVILVIGIRESAWFNAAMVAVKMVIIVFFLVVGAFYVQPENWSPFAPHGFHGISMGAAIIFFAYIGFDAVSTAAEETRDPQRNMPIGILASLVVCTVLYIAVAVVLTGMVKTEQLGTAEPLATAFAARGIHWAAGIVAFGAVVATTSVLFVFQLGQPRILFCNGAGSAAARLGRQGAPEISHAVCDHDPDRACWWRALRASATSTKWSSCATLARCSPLCWSRRESWCCGALIRTARARFGRRGCPGCRWGQSSPAPG